MTGLDYTLNNTPKIRIYNKIHSNIKYTDYNQINYNQTNNYGNSDDYGNVHIISLVG
jgi:hypothetical protein